MFTMTEEVNLKFMIDAELRDRLGELLDRKRTTLTRGMAELISWLLDQDDVTQSMILGQIRPTPALIKMVLEATARRGHAPPPRIGRINSAAGGKSADKEPM
jgi:hypothetical protein